MNPNTSSSRARNRPISRRALGLLSALLITSVSIARAQVAVPDWPELYDPFRVVTINLQMPPGDWATVVGDESLSIVKTAQLWSDGETPITVTVKRKSDPPVGPKVSLKIDFNALVPGQKWHSVQKLSLENGNGGNSVVKEGFAWQLHRMASEAGFYNHPAAYAAWVRLVVNGELIGVYVSSEERDDQMLKNRGMWKEAATWLYKNDPNTAIEDGAPGDSPAYGHLNYRPFRGSNSAPANLEADLTTWKAALATLPEAVCESAAERHRRVIRFRALARCARRLYIQHPVKRAIVKSGSRICECFI